MTDRSHSASSIWFSSLIALLVGLGGEVLLSAAVPASLTDLQIGSPDVTTFHRAGEWQMWAIDSAIRLLSFSLGGFVGALLVRVVSRKLFAMLLCTAALATVFQPLPGPGPLSWWALWALVAPVGVALGAWVAREKQRAA